MVTQSKSITLVTLLAVTGLACGEPISDAATMPNESILVFEAPLGSGQILTARCSLREVRQPTTAPARIRVGKLEYVPIPIERERYYEFVIRQNDAAEERLVWNLTVPDLGRQDWSECRVLAGRLINGSALFIVYKAEGSAYLTIVRLDRPGEPVNPIRLLRESDAEGPIITAATITSERNDELARVKLFARDREVASKEFDVRRAN